MISLVAEVALPSTSAPKWENEGQTLSFAQETDELVYELYNLTDKEIRIVEEATRE